MSGKSSRQLYKDCLRMIRHASGTQSPKSRELRTIVKREFLRNKNEQDDAKVESLKFNAVRALSNYLILQSAGKDGKFR